MISMARQQQGDFNRCCDFLARMIEKYIIRILKCSNLNTLKKRQDLLRLHQAYQNGQKKLMQLDCMLNVENTAEHLRIRILHLNLLLLSVRCSNCT